MERIKDYLEATQLCDFDAAAAIREKALSLTKAVTDNQQRFERVYEFVKGLPYGLEDWDVKASETLRKGWGMCSGKTNLLVAMSRSISIPARYRIFKIKPERRLLAQVMEHDKILASAFGDMPPTQDHVQCEVYLNGWHVYDPSRDPDFENGLRILGIPLDRIPVVGADGAVHFDILASIDEWAKARQGNRKVRDDREKIFATANHELDKVRRLGKGKISR